MKNRTKVAVRAAAVLLLAILTAGSLALSGAAGAATVSNDRNLCPIAVNLSVSTFRNIPVKGQMIAEDPENDAITYELADNPKLGTVHADRDGSFVYTPIENKKGHDSFSYVAIDAAWQYLRQSHCLHHHQQAGRRTSLMPTWRATAPITPRSCWRKRAF